MSEMNWKADMPAFKEKTDEFYAGNLPMKGFLRLLWKLFSKRR